MKFYKLVLINLLLLFTSTGKAQEANLFFEQTAQHSGMIGSTDLDGFFTWKLYIQLENSTDVVHSVYSSSENNISLNLLTDYLFFQYSGGGFFAEEITCTDILEFPEAKFDSYFTIGRETSCSPGSPIIDTVINPPFWIAAQEFELGLNVSISEGHWEIENDDVAGIPDDDNRVLLGQFTAEVDFFVSLNVEIYQNGNPDTPIYLTNLTADSGPVGCTDSEADNYDSVAVVDDGSCLYLGCTNSTACNYDSQANEDDLSCEYLSCLGCIDSVADNYESTATIDDGSCQYLGCMDSSACEYDSNANVDDGSCVYPGCMDSSADNYDPDAGCDNGACEYLGCTDATACEYDPDANMDDGTCVYPGCMDSNAENYDPDAGCDYGLSCIYACITDSISVTWVCLWDEIQEDYTTGFNFYSNWEGDCIISEICFTSSSPPLQYCFIPEEEDIEILSDSSIFVSVPWVIPGAIDVTVETNIDFSQTIELSIFNCLGGCMDIEADNYNSIATIDDGSCSYPVCDFNIVLIDFETFAFASEISWAITNSDDETIYTNPSYQNSSIYSDTICLPDDCYHINMSDSWGDGWNGSFFNIITDGSIIASGSLESGFDAFDVFSINSTCPIVGCTDYTACNYYSLAEIDNGSCIYSTDPCEETNPETGNNLIGPFNQFVDQMIELPLENLDISKKIQISIHSYNGGLFFNQSYISPQDRIKIQLNISSLKKGIYWLTAINGNNKETVSIGIFE